jgi:hypothetical protein
MESRREANGESEAKGGGAPLATPDEKPLKNNNHVEPLSIPNARE